MLRGLFSFALTPAAVNVSIWSRNRFEDLENRTCVCYYNDTKQEQAAPDRNEVAFMQHKNMELMKEINTYIGEFYLSHDRTPSTTEIARKKKYTPGYVRKVKRNGEQLLAMLTPERVESTLPLWYLKKEKDRKKA